MATKVRCEADMCESYRDGECILKSITIDNDGMCASYVEAD